jgi:O-antigen/teichoic acid export membrane protein
MTDLFFRGLSVALVAAAAITVVTQLLESTAKACSQGFDDLPGANRIIFFEEFMFLPGYLIAHVVGLRGPAAVLGGLVCSDLLTLSSGWVRLARRGFFRDAGRASVELAKKVLAYGFRGGVGTVVLLLNARLDFLIVGAIVGPAQLGIYAVASRFAELLRLPPLAVNYVLYPELAAADPHTATTRARSLISRVGIATAALAIPLALIATFAIPFFYGAEFRPAVAPTYVLLLGLSLGGVGGVITAWLFARAHPGLSSLAQTAGLVVTVTLDLALIPVFGIMGAAVASCLAYLTASIFLIVFFVKRSRPYRSSANEPHIAVERASTGVDG